MLNLKVIRIPRGLDYTEGQLFNKDTNASICDILEDKIRQPQKDVWKAEYKVYGKTAIPYGIYPIEVIWSPKFKKNIVGVLDVPDFKYIRLHYGYDEDNSEGCLLVGEKNKNGKLHNIGMTDKLVFMLMAAGGRGTIEII